MSLALRAHQISASRDQPHPHLSPDECTELMNDDLPPLRNVLIVLVCALVPSRALHRYLDRLAFDPLEPGKAPKVKAPTKSGADDLRADEPLHRTAS